MRTNYINAVYKDGSIKEIDVVEAGTEKGLKIAVEKRIKKLEKVYKESKTIDHFIETTHKLNTWEIM